MIQLEDIIKAVRIVVCWELTERLDYTKSEAAKILNITPAAISHYSSGKRGTALADRLRSSKKSYKIISSLSDELSEDHRKGKNIINKRFVDSAEKILPYIEKSDPIEPNKDIKAINKILRERLIEEQKSANEISNISVQFRDDVLKQIMTTIEIDSIRHGEIVLSIMNRLNNQENCSFSKSDIKLIEKLVESEESVDDEKLSEIKSSLDPISRILIEAIESDERKHVDILRKLLKNLKENSTI